MEEQNATLFQIWLAAYESRLVEVKQAKAPLQPQSAGEAKSQLDAPSRES